MTGKHELVVTGENSLVDDRTEEAAANFIADVQYAIGAAIIERGVSRSEIAKRLKKSKATIARQLDGDANLTLKTISAILVAIGDEPSFTTRVFEEMKRARKVNSRSMLVDTGNVWQIHAVVKDLGLDFEVPARAEETTEASWVEAELSPPAPRLRSTKTFAQQPGFALRTATTVSDDG